MIFKVSSQQEETENKDSKFLSSRPISKNQVQGLHIAYKFLSYKFDPLLGKVRAFDPKQDTRCGWFSVAEIIHFLKRNNIDISDQTSIDESGIRIYLGYHHTLNDFHPTDPLYFNHDTPILVATKKNGEINEDVFKDDKSFIALPDKDGEDNAKLCPPECDGTLIK